VRFWPCAILLLVNRLLQAETATPPVSELPIRFHDGLLWAEVCVPQSKEAMHFLLDSGASVSVVNLNTARRLGLALGPKASVTGVATTLSGFWPVRLSAKVSQFELPSEYLALDLSKLSSACSRTVDGLIGADFFRDRVVEIDYASQKLRVLAASPTNDSTNAVRLETRHCGLRVAVNVNGGKRQWVRVDTGCATAFHWVTSKEQADRCTSKIAVGLAELSIPQILTSLRIGSHRFDTVPTGLHRKAIFSGESGLLGNGVLASFGVVIFDAKSGRLFLGPSPAL
jgi:predicted aspartyl protease